MEQVGKYQSLQDRIKRLTKNQVTKLGFIKKQQENSQTKKVNQTQDCDKQNFTKIKYLNKKRQTSQINLHKFTFTQYNQKFNYKVIDTIRSSSPKKTETRSYSQYRETKENLSKCLIIQKNKQSIQNGSQQQDFTSRILKNSFYETQEALNPLIANINNQNEKNQSFIKNYSQITTRQRSCGLKKPTKIISLKTEQEQNINNLLQDQSIQKQFERNSMSEAQEITNRLDTLVKETKSRALKKHRSGNYDRIPGKIIKNR